MSQRALKLVHSFYPDSHFLQSQAKVSRQKIEDREEFHQENSTLHSQLALFYSILFWFIAQLTTIKPNLTLNHLSPLFVSHAVRSYASHSHDDESFDAFSSRYVQFFSSVEDLFELQRGLNNCFAYDLVPSTEVIEAALRASRRVNDYSTAVRVFEGIREKVENQNQYQQYLEALKEVREELGLSLKEELYQS